MTRDFKPSSPHRATTRKGRKARGGTLLGVFIGLVVGIAAALAVVWYMNKAPVPFVSSRTQAPVDTGKAGNGPAPAATPAPLPGKPGDPPVEKRFQFYDILPGKTEAKPSGKPDPAATPAPDKRNEAGKAPAADIQLQAGSFQSAKDADNLKATLALSGLEAAVQQVMVGDKVWYRVRLGPYAKSDEADRVKSELAKLGVAATVVKGKD